MTQAVDTGKTVAEFYEQIREIHDLGATQALLGWDLETHMPEKGAEMRAKQMSTLARLSHEMMTGPKMTEAVARLREPGVAETLDQPTQALIREVGRNFDKSKKTPPELLQAMVETTAKAHTVWVEARANKDFKRFEPLLGEIVTLNRRLADALGYEDSPYDALLDEYEPGLTVKQLDPLFAKLKSDIVPLLKAIQESGITPDTSVLTGGTFPAEDQIRFSKEVLKAMGFDFAAGRLDLSAHPFSSGSSTTDVRLTTRVDEHDVFSALSSSMHEGGHGMYEQGINPEFNRTPLAEGTSLGIHESQSRMWENQVGRSRAFWEAFFPKLQQSFPDMKAVSLDAFYRAINRVKPSFIRVESDEVTYNLHILVRYEIEKAVIEGRMQVSEIPEAWNAKMKEYLGITPPDVSQGCLQDIHWSHGSFGYFPTYTLGNLYAAQFFHTAKDRIPDLEKQIAQGNLSPLKNWLNREIHWVGKSEDAATIVQRVTNEPLNANYFVRYLWAKYGEIFSISLPAG
jgi:carboxypeptidase Taq